MIAMQKEYTEYSPEASTRANPLMPDRGCGRHPCPTAERLRALIPPRVRSAVIEEIIAETHDTRSYVLRLEQGWLHYPGQHVRIALEIEGRRHERTYSLSSMPSSEAPKFTVKRQAAGIVSSWLVANLAVGSRLEVSEPEGDFVLQHGSDDLLFLAAGSGVTPIASMIRRALHEGRAVTLLHVDRRPADGMFRGDFRHLASKHPRFRYIPWFTSLHGRPERELRELISAATSDIYLCGPQGFMDHCLSTAAEMGVPPDRLFRESFGVVATAGGEPVSLSLRGSDGEVTRVTGRIGATLLEVLRSEIGFPSICGGHASCGTCRVAIENGHESQRTPANRAEARLLQVLPDPSPNHRLACQIRLTAEHEGACFSAAPIL